jgi:hypothetical protein
MQPPEEVKLSREDGEALIERSKASNLASDDQGVVVKLMGVYFWLTLALEETKIGLKWLKVAVFGEGRKKRGLAGGGSGGSGPVPRQAQPRPSHSRGHRRSSRGVRNRAPNGVVATAAGVLRPIGALSRWYCAAHSGAL